MDQNNCTGGIFSDRFFHPPNSASPSCDSPVIVWLVIAICIACVRLGCALISFAVWIGKRVYIPPTGAAKAVKNAGKTAFGQVVGALPVQPLASLGLALTVVVYVALTSTNVANATNGVPIYLIAQFMLFGTVSHYFFEKKLMKLGKAIFQSHKLEASGDLLARISRGDGVIKLLWMVGVVCWFGLAASAVASLVLPSASGLFEVVFALIGIYSLSQPMLIAWQLRRIVKAMDKTTHATREMTREPGSQTSADNRRVARSRRRIRSQQLGVLVVGITASLLNLLIAGRAVPSTWWLVGLPHFFYEAAFEAFSLWNLHRKTLSTIFLKRSEGRSGNNSSNNNRKVGVDDANQMMNQASFINSGTASSLPNGMQRQNSAFLSNNGDQAGQQIPSKKSTLVGTLSAHPMNSAD